MRVQAGGFGRLRFLAVLFCLATWPFLFPVNSPAAEPLDFVFGSNFRVAASDYYQSCYPRSLAVQGSTLHLVWSQDEGGATEFEIYYARSADGGRTWTSPLRINDVTNNRQFRPSIAVFGSSQVYLVWQDARGSSYDIYFAKSSDGGTSFSPNIKVNDDSSTEPQGSPRIAVDIQGNIYAVWADRRNGTGWDIYFAKSTNGGTSFLANRPVTNTNLGSDGETPDLALDANGNPYVVWDSIDSGLYCTYFSKSTDGGQNWTAPVKVNDNSGGGQAMWPVVDLDSQNNIYVAWTDWRNPPGDIYFARSLNGGASFSTNICILDPGGTGNYQEYPSLRVDNSDNILVTWEDWRSGHTHIYFTSSSDQGLTWAANVRVDDTAGETFTQEWPSVAVNNEGRAFVAWRDNRYSGVGSIHVASGWPTEWVRSGANPVLSPGPNGSWDDEGISSPYIIKGSPYRMWFFGHGGAGAPGQIGYAESADGLTWNKYSGNPVIPVGSPGSWNDEQIENVVVIRTPAGYEAWATGWDGSQTAGGYYTSSDGLSWNQYSGNPVIQPGTSGSWDSAGVTPAAVIKMGDTYKMWYVGKNNAGQGGVGYATSADGINWAKHASNPIFSPQPETWEYASIEKLSLIYDGYLYHLWYQGRGTGSLANKFGYASSSDGVNWTRGGNNPVFGPKGHGWEGNHLEAPYVWQDGLPLKMWYSGYNVDHIGSIGLASKDLVSTSESYSLTIPAGTAVTDYRMGTAPLYLVSSFTETLAPQIGTYDTRNMRIGHWEHDLQAYIEYPFSDDPGSHDPGGSAWFLFRHGQTLNFSGTRTVVSSGPMGLCWYASLIDTGWNQIGNPFPFAVDVNGLMVKDLQTLRYVTAADNTLTQRTVWVYTGGNYQAATVLQPGSGGWIKSHASNDLWLCYPAADAHFPAADAVLDRDEEEKPPPPPGYSLYVNYNSGGVSAGGGCFIESLWEDQDARR